MDALEVHCGGKVNSLLQSPDVTKKTSPVDVTYGESLRLFWRLYWLPILCATITLFVLGALLNTGQTRMSPIASQILSSGVFIGFLFLLIPRIFQPFKRFKLELIASDGQAMPLVGMRHIRLAIFVLVRLLGAAFAVGFLLIPLNIFFSLFRINLTQPIALGSLFFIAGPYTMKMMVSHAFSDFHIEVRRPEENATCIQEP
jgi:hypothetical protein